MTQLRLELSQSDGEYRPGDVIAGEAHWELEANASVDVFELRLFWYAVARFSAYPIVVWDTGIDIGETRSSQWHRAGTLMATPSPSWKQTQTMKMLRWPLMRMGTELNTPKISSVMTLKLWIEPSLFRPMIWYRRVPTSR